MFWLKIRTFILNYPLLCGCFKKVKENMCNIIKRKKRLIVDTNIYQHLKKIYSIKMNEMIYISIFVVFQLCDLIDSKYKGGHQWNYREIA